MHAYYKKRYIRRMSALGRYLTCESLPQRLLFSDFGIACRPIYVCMYVLSEKQTLIKRELRRFIYSKVAQELG